MSSSIDVREWVCRAMAKLAQTKDELTRLDAAAGDGDLGVTVSSGARDVAAAVTSLGDHAHPYEYWRAAGAAFARGNPSSYAALMGAGLLAAARAVKNEDSFTITNVSLALDAAFEMIAERGRSRVGQRTVLDAIDPARQALRSGSGQPAAELLASMSTAAERGAAATAEMTPEKGRALWVGNRAQGHPDAGAVAFQRLLKCLAATLPAESVGPTAASVAARQTRVDQT
jgi:dihydroxyacetone kinase-like protein